MLASTKVKAEVLRAYGAAGVHGLVFFDTLSGEMDRQFIHSKERRAGLFANLGGVADVVVVAVGEGDVGDAAGDGVPVETRVSKVGLPFRNGSRRTTLLPVSMRKAECPSQVIFMRVLQNGPHCAGARGGFAQARVEVLLTTLRRRVWD